MHYAKKRTLLGLSKIVRRHRSDGFMLKLVATYEQRSGHSQLSSPFWNCIHMLYLQSSIDNNINAEGVRSFLFRQNYNSTIFFNLLQMNLSAVFYYDSLLCTLVLLRLGDMLLCKQQTLLIFTCF